MHHASGGYRCHLASYIFSESLVVLGSLIYSAIAGVRGLLQLVVRRMQCIQQVKIYRVSVPSKSRCSGISCIDEMTTGHPCRRCPACVVVSGLCMAVWRLALTWRRTDGLVCDRRFDKHIVMLHYSNGLCQCLREYVDMEGTRMPYTW